MISPIKNDDGHVEPFVHFSKSDVLGPIGQGHGVVKGGCCAVNADGKLAPVVDGDTTKPTYIALASYSADDIPAIRIQPDTIYVSTISSTAALKIGSKLKLNSYGNAFTLADNGVAVAECVGLSGTTSGSEIRVRFLSEPTEAAAGLTEAEDDGDDEGGSASLTGNDDDGSGSDDNGSGSDDNGSGDDDNGSGGDDNGSGGTT